MDTNLLVVLALGVVGSGVLVAAWGNRGQNEVRMVIDGRVFQFPQWVVTAINQGMNQVESDAIGEVGAADIVIGRIRR